MGFFDSDWIVEYEYSEGFLRSIKKSLIEVKASTSVSAGNKVKEMLKPKYSYFKILSATEKNKYYAKETPKEVTKTNDDYKLSEKDEETIGKLIVIDIKKAEIARENRRPKVTFLIGLLISVAAFLLGWIPYWYFDSKLRAIRDTITSLYRRGHDVNEPEIVELINQGLQYKASRDSIIWLPFVILGIVIVATIIITVIASKKKPARVAKCRRELEDLEKKISER